MLDLLRISEQVSLVPRSVFEVLGHWYRRQGAQGDPYSTSPNIPGFVWSERLPRQGCRRP